MTEEEQKQDQAPESEAPQEAPGETVDELSAARAQAQDYLRSWQRTQADFVNYKRRIEQDRADLEATAGAQVIRALLPVIDDLDRAVAALPAEGAPDQSWAQGIVQIVRKLHVVLGQQGLEAIEALGAEFDPTLHEAVMQVDAGPETAGKVTAEAQRGFRLRGRVLRPAQVVVGRASEPAD